MEDRLENVEYQEDLSMYNTISIVATDHLNKFSNTGTYDCKPAWMNILIFIVNLHYYHKYKVPLFYGKFTISSHTVVPSFKPTDDAILSGTQAISTIHGARIITKDFFQQGEQYTYSRLNEESEDYHFIKELVENILSKTYVGSNNYNLHDELVDFGFMDVTSKYVYPNTGCVSNEDYKYMTNKYFKGVEKTVKKPVTSIRSSSNVIEFNRTKK